MRPLCYLRAMFERDLASPAETARLGEALGGCLSPGDTLGLVGDLGAGKTCFVQGLAAGLAVPAAARVTSPTFTLINEYRGGRITLHHVDLYRIERARELDELGLDELIGGGGALAIEWSDRFSVLPADHLEVRLEVTGPETRRLRAVAGGPRSEALLAAWQTRLG